MKNKTFEVQPHQTRTLSWWYKQRKNIDLEPSYQRRGGLWGDHDKAYLIDSIINGFDVPKIYLSDFTLIDSNLNEKSLTYAVIDGRQRLEAIFDFFSDDLKLNSDFVFLKNPDINLANHTYSQIKSLYSEIAEIAEEFNLAVMSVITDDKEKIRDLFVRLNKSKPLTGAEIRNAMDGLVPDLVRGIIDSRFFKENISFKTDRGQDKNLAAKLLLIEHQKQLTDTKKAQLDKLFKESRNTLNPEDYTEAAIRVQNNIKHMESIFIKRDPLLKREGLIPIYYELCKKAKNEGIREFIGTFEQERKKNQVIARTNPENADSQLLSFDSSVRNINDGISLRTALKIIESEYLSAQI